MGIIYDSTQTLGLIATGIIPNPLLASNNIVLIGGSHKRNNWCVEVKVSWFSFAILNPKRDSSVPNILAISIISF